MEKNTLAVFHHLSHSHIPRLNFLLEQHPRLNEERPQQRAATSEKESIFLRLFNASQKLPNAALYSGSCNVANQGHGSKNKVQYSCGSRHMQLVEGGQSGRIFRACILYIYFHYCDEIFSCKCFSSIGYVNAMLLQLLPKLMFSLIGVVVIVVHKAGTPTPTKSYHI